MNTIEILELVVLNSVILSVTVWITWLAITSGNIDKIIIMLAVWLGLVFWGAGQIREIAIRSKR